MSRSDAQRLRREVSRSRALRAHSPSAAQCQRRKRRCLHVMRTECSDRADRALLYAYLLNTNTIDVVRPTARISAAGPARLMSDRVGGKAIAAIRSSLLVAH